jgi:hypothetical protein
VKNSTKLLIAAIFAVLVVIVSLVSVIKYALTPFPDSTHMVSSKTASSTLISLSKEDEQNIRISQVIESLYFVKCEAFGGQIVGINVPVITSTSTSDAICRKGSILYSMTGFINSKWVKQQ